MRAPKEVRAAFSEQPDPRGSELAVFDTSGKRVDAGGTAVSDEPNGLRVSLAAIGDGGYTVAWTVLSTVDGHTTRGSFAFAVGDAPLPKIADVGQEVSPPTPFELAGRFLSFAGIALALGVAAFGLAVRAFADAPAQRREQLVLALAGGLLVAGSVTLLLDQGGRAPPRLTALLGIRGLAGVTILGGAAAFAPTRLRLVALAAGVVAAMTATLVSPAAPTGGARDVALDLAHLLAVSVWAGGVVAMLAIAIPSSSDGDADLGRTVWRFSLVALASVGALVATGTLQAFDRLVLIEDLIETPYGIALLAKIVLLAIALVLGALNLLAWGPRLRAAADATRSRRRLALATLGETALLAVVLAAAAALTALVPPDQPSGAAFDETRHVAGLRLRLLVPTVTPGTNRYVLRVSQGLTPVSDARKVAFRFTMVEHDMGQSELVAEQRAPGEYVATGSATVMFGTWRVESIVRLPEREDVRTVFTVPVGAPTGPGAVARALAAGPYTLIVFVSPPQPVAGAPFTLHAVVVDAKGEPVPGKALRASFSGPGRETIGARETARGQYEMPVAALDAGTWQVDIDVGGEGQARYELEVAR